MKKNNRASTNTQMNMVKTGPPAKPASIMHTHVFRFRSTSTAGVQITTKSLQNLLVMASSATSVYSLISAWKLNYVEVWGFPSASAASTISIEYNGESGIQTGRSRRVQDVSLGNSFPSHVKLAPSKDALASKWQSNSSLTSSVNLFSLGLTAESIVDVSLSFVLNDSSVPIGPTTVAGATTGLIYIRSLDNESGTLLPPVSFPTI